MPSPILKFTKGRFVDTNYGIFVRATKKSPLVLQKRNGKKATRGRWMNIETEVFYSMIGRSGIKMSEIVYDCPCCDDAQEYVASSELYHRYECKCGAKLLVLKVVKK